MTNGHPVLKTWKSPLVGDVNVTMIERVDHQIWTRRKIVRLKMPPDQHRGTVCDDMYLQCKQRVRGRMWSGRPIRSTWHSYRRLAIINRSGFASRTQATGEVREVMQESAPKFFESGDGMVNWHYLPASNEVLWFSERDNWGQLYLYDLTHRQAQEPDHAWRRQCDAGAACRPEKSRDLLPRGGQRGGAAILTSCISTAFGSMAAIRRC